MSPTEAIISADKPRMIAHGLIVGVCWILGLILCLGSLWAAIAVCMLFGLLLWAWMPDYIRLWRNPVICRLQPAGIRYRGIFLPREHIGRWARYGTQRDFGIRIYLKDSQGFLTNNHQHRLQLLSLIDIYQPQPYLSVSLGLAKQSPKKIMKIMQEWYAESGS